MKISVIIATHNTENYIKKCLDSILNQTLKDLEIIIIDDASTDNTPSILSDYAKKHQNITIQIQKESYGPGTARNNALFIAKGEYISFIDSDDWIDLNYFEFMYNRAQATNADIVACGLIREYDYLLKSPVYKCYYDREYCFTGEIAFRIMTWEYNYGLKFIPSALNKIYRREFLEKNSLKFAENIYFEDQPFSYTCTLAAQKVLCVPDVLYHHYKRTGSIVQSFSTKNVDDMMTAYIIIRNFLKDKGIYEKYQFNYYSSLQHFYNLIVRQIFEFVLGEEERKIYLKYSFKRLKEIIDINEYIDFLSAEEIRRHIQPEIEDTTIY